MGMDQYTEPLQALSDIRSMMEKSTKFVTLSGATGIVIGVIALGYATICYAIVGSFPFQEQFYHMQLDQIGQIAGLAPYRFIFLLGFLTLLLAIIAGYTFTSRKTKKAGVQLWTRSFRQMVVNIAIPLGTGGVFCVALILGGALEFVAPAMLIFYGLSLINGAKYTLQDINSLGLAQVLLGVVALFIPGYGLEFWTIGFGLFHIYYGVRLYLRQ